MSLAIGKASSKTRSADTGQQGWALKVFLKDDVDGGAGVGRKVSAGEEVMLYLPANLRWVVTSPGTLIMTVQPFFLVTPPRQLMPTDQL